MWDLMYPAAYRARSYGSGGGGGYIGSGANRRCQACGARIGIARMASGQRVTLNYCQQHFCRRVTKFGDGREGVCQNRNNGRSKFCDDR